MRGERTLRRSPDVAPGDAVGTCLRHVLVVGGTPADWASTDEARWTELLAELSREVGDAGGQWLTIRPYAGDAAGDGVAPGPAGLHQIEACRVVVDGCADGRARLLAAIERVRAAHGAAAITEEALGAELLRPATVEADLALVLGRADRLPPSLVWELAYSELVFTDCSWSDLGEKHVHDAIVEFSRRERRFGGLPS